MSGSTKEDRLAQHRSCTMEVPMWIKPDKTPAAETVCKYIFLEVTKIAKFMGPTWGPSGADRTQVGPMLAPWTFVQQLVQVNNKENCKALHCFVFVRRILTIDKYCGKRFHVLGNHDNVMGIPQGCLLVPSFRRVRICKVTPFAHLWSHQIYHRPRRVDYHVHSVDKRNTLQSHQNPCFSEHYSDVIMSAMHYQITGISIVCSAVCWCADHG